MSLRITEKFAENLSKHIRHASSPSAPVMRRVGQAALVSMYVGAGIGAAVGGSLGARKMRNTIGRIELELDEKEVRGTIQDEIAYLSISKTAVAGSVLAGAAVGAVSGALWPVTIGSAIYLKSSGSLHGSKSEQEPSFLNGEISL